MGHRGGEEYTRTFRLFVDRGLKRDVVEEGGIAFLDRYGGKRGAGAPFVAYHGGTPGFRDYAGFIWFVQIFGDPNDIVLDVTWTRPGGGTVQVEANTGTSQDWIDVVFPYAPTPNPLASIPPTLTLDQPSANFLRYSAAAQQVHFAATAVDATGAQLDGPSVVWERWLETLPASYELLGTGTLLTLMLGQTPQDAARNQPSSPSIRVTAKGSNGLTTSRSVTLIFGRAILRRAEFVAQEVPSFLRPGQRAEVRVTMRNTGDESWDAGGPYRLGSQSPQDNTMWGLGRVAVASTVGPGQEVTFAFEITAPPRPGQRAFQWCMLQEGVTWFGELTPMVTVVVDDGPGVTTVPEVTGLARGAAVAAVGAARLVPHVVGPPGTFTEVIRQEPSAGQLVDAWSTVNLTVRSTLDDQP